MILVVGATGQLGGAIVRLLLARGLPVRVMVRQASAVRSFEALGCEACLGDITRPGETKGAFPNVTTVIATANSAMPSKAGDSIRNVDIEGYRNLVEAAKELGACRQFIFTSVIGASPTNPVPLFRAKFQTEQLLQASGLSYTIFRFPAFLDVVAPMMGLGRLANALQSPTVARDFAFARSHFDKIKDSVEKEGVIHIAGRGDNPQAFISVDDCARLIAASIGRPECIGRILEITGPAALTPEELARTIERILGKPLKRKKTPAWLFAILGRLMRAANPAAANLMLINRYSALESTPVAGQDIARLLGVSLSTPEQWLRERLSH
jgi:NADH dehydrogenase